VADFFVGGEREDDAVMKELDDREFSEFKEFREIKEKH